MNRESVLRQAREGELYPAVIVHGGGEPERRAFALDLARSLLCESEPAARPCGRCRHCRRVVWPESGSERFHPDLLILERDLKTATSVEATRNLLRTAQVSPFEARGQVFLIANAETLSAEAANSLLKVLEEPHDSAPRHFLLLTPSRLDLLPTLRSRSLSIYLGPAAGVDGEQVAAAAERFAAAVTAYAAAGAPVYLLAAAKALQEVGDYREPRNARPWVAAAAVVVEAARATDGPPALRRRLLALADALLAAPPWRLRGIPAERILQGLVSRHLAAGEREAV